MSPSNPTTKAILPDQSNDTAHRVIPAGWWWMIPIFAMVVFFTFGSGLNGVFVYDDLKEIADNPNIRTLWPITTPLFKANQLPVRPIPYLSFALNYAVHEQTVEGYHYVNISIHLLIGMILWWIIWKTICLSGINSHIRHPELLSFCCVIIWLVHPLQTQAVTYIYQRMELLMSLFFVLTWLTLLLAVTTKKDGYRLLFYLMSFIFCLLGTLSKEVMVVVPAFIIWYDRLFFSSSWVELFKKRWGYYLGLSGCWIVLGGLINSQAELYPEYNRQMPSRFEYLMTQAEVITHYLKLVFDPRVLCFDYGWPIVHDFFQVWPQFCFIVGLFIGAICLMLKYPIIGLIAGSFFLFLGPTSSINPVLAPAYEYRMYLALLPIILLNMLVCYYVIGKIFTSSRTQQMAFMLLTSIFALPLCYLSHERCQLYTNFEVLWMDTLNKAPNYFLPYYMLGHHYDEEGDPEKALPYCQKAVELAPRDPDSKNNYGLCLLELNRIEEAQRVLLENLQSNPSHIDTLNNLGTAYGMQNDLQSAERCFMQILKLKNEHIGAKINLARLSLLKGDYTAADTFLQQIIRSEPVNFQAIVMQTELYLLQKKFRQAKQIIDYLIQNYPDHPDTKRLSSQLP